VRKEESLQNFILFFFILSFILLFNFKFLFYFLKFIFEGLEQLHPFTIFPLVKLFLLKNRGEGYSGKS